MHKIIFYLLMAISFSSMASSDVTGRWSPSCNDEEGITLTNDNSTVFFIVNHNQIVISMQTKTTKESIDFFLVKPVDLGSGGMKLNWSDFSKKLKIATLKLHEQSANFEWYGFYDEIKKVHSWVNDPDIIINNEIVGGGVVFYRCIK